MKKESLTNNTILLMIGTICNKGLQFLMIPLFSAWLDTASYGNFDVYCTYISLLTPIVTLSIQEGVFRFSVESEKINEKKVFISNGFIVCTFGLVIVSGILLTVSFLYNANNIFPFLLYFVSEIFSIYLRGVLRALKRLDIYSYSAPIVSGCIFIATYYLVYKSNMQLSGILLGYGIGTLIGNIIICVAIKITRLISVKYVNLSTIKQLIMYSMPLIPNDISWWVINASDRKIINIFLGAEANGIYALSYKMPSFCAAIFGVFSLSWQQEAIAIINCKERDVRFCKIFNKLLQLLLTFCTLLTAINFIFFYYIFDKRYYEGINYVPLLIAAVMLTSISQYFGGIQISMKKPKENGITTVLGAISNVLIHLLLVRAVGLWAAVISTVIANAIVILSRWSRIKKDISFKLERNIFLLLMVYLLSVIMSFLNLDLSWRWIILICFIIALGVINYKGIIKIVKER